MFNEIVNEQASLEIGYVAQEWKEAAREHMTPSSVMRPKIFIDGNQWCALYGDNIQDGVAGFGRSPHLAMGDFDYQWTRSLPSPDEARDD